VPGYTVASGSVIHWRGGIIVGGSVAPEVYLAELGPDGLQAALTAGTLIGDAPARKEYRVGPGKEKGSE
jgi:hypothetical protein